MVESKNYGWTFTKQGDKVKVYAPFIVHQGRFIEVNSREYAEIVKSEKKSLKK